MTNEAVLDDDPGDLFRPKRRTQKFDQPGAITGDDPGCNRVVALGNRLHVVRAIPSSLMPFAGSWRSSPGDAQGPGERPFNQIALE
jgi:hypothetical protein